MKATKLATVLIERPKGSNQKFDYDPKEKQALAMLNFVILLL